VSTVAITMRLFCSSPTSLRIKNCNTKGDSDYQIQPSPTLNWWNLSTDWVKNIMIAKNRFVAMSMILRVVTHTLATGFFLWKLKLNSLPWGCLSALSRWMKDKNLLFQLWTDSQGNSITHWENGNNILIIANTTESRTCDIAFFVEIRDYIL